MNMLLTWLKKLLGMNKPQPPKPPTPTPTPQPIQGESDMTEIKRALCIGINDYPGQGNDLQGCVNDALDWSNLLKATFGFTEIDTLLNTQATYANVTQAIERLISKTQPGELLVITYSGHGTSVLDKNGDEPGDRRDEALCLYDRLLIDDVIKDYLSAMRDGASLVVISDSCHSGSVTRMAMDDTYSVPRYMPPTDGDTALALNSLPLKGRAFRSNDEESMKDVLLTGCRSDQVSYDARINGRYSGAMTFNAIKAIRENPQATWSEFYKTLRRYLPSSQYNQEPQLEGSAANKNKKLFS